MMTTCWKGWCITGMSVAKGRGSCHGGQGSGEALADGGDEMFVGLGLAGVAEDEEAAALIGADEVGPLGAFAGFETDGPGKTADGEQRSP